MFGGDEVSFYSFIATTDEIPEIEGKEKYITVKEAIELQIKPHEYLPWEKMDPNSKVIVIENEEDLNELVIKKDTYYDVRDYTSYPYIYEINFAYSKIRIEQLLNYLKENIIEGQLVELWSVWIGDNDTENIPFSRCFYEELTLDHLEQMYNSDHRNYKEQCCFVIDR